MNVASRGVAEDSFTRLGVCFSGGGIRAATFALGVYQQLLEHGIWARVRYLSAVSGGSYIAAALAISHALSPQALCERGRKPWSHNSPEELRLRRNLTYLAPGNVGGMWLFANLLYGLLVNLVPLLLGSFLAGRLVGSVLHYVYPGIGTGHLDTRAFGAAGAVAVLLLLCQVLVVGRRRFYDKNRSRAQIGTSRSEQVILWLMAGFIAVLTVGMLLPAVVQVGSRISLLGGLAAVGAHGTERLLDRAGLGLIVIFVSIGSGIGAVWMLRRRRFERLRGVLAGFSGLGILLTPFLLASATAARRGIALPVDGLVFGGVGLVITVFGVFVHNRRYSMHLFYRERLQNAFATRRVATEDDTGVEVQGIPYTDPVLLSHVAEENARRSSELEDQFPELIMCAAVAARGSEEPNKARAASFTFKGDISGNEATGLIAETRMLERGDWIGGGDITLPSMMAISGAAISPLMGRFTLPAFRFLLAILNVRLGVWIRNPAVPIPDSPADVPLWHRIGGYVKRGWREPGAWYVLKEGLGLASRAGRYIYISDGGHWENLGLTELFRNRCTHVVVVDGTGDRHLGEMARAMAIARAELGVEINVDPRVTSPDEEGNARSPVAIGRFRYPDGREGDIYYARCVMWEEAPSDLHIFRRREAIFPNHPTSNQFLSGELFDAYRALGSAAGARLSEEITLPDVRYDEPRTYS